jgi:Cu+-exporting ATPase
VDPALNLDPVCGMRVDPITAADHRLHNDRDFYFCSVGCAKRFEEDPSRYLSAQSATATGPIRLTMTKKPPSSSSASDSHLPDDN